MMMESNPIVVHGDGLQTRSLTWIHDVIEGLLKVNDSSNLSGKAFNLGSNEEISMIDLATIIGELRGVEIVHGESNHGDSKRRLPDISMNDEIDWHAKTSLEDGLAQLL
jgi:nucleoside-diphosphate-sugar epimerase